MSKFGTLLRNLRESCRDPMYPARKLSQQKFGELLGDKLGIRGQGYSGAAVSDWERGKSKIHADDRLVLMAIIMVLHECGGLQTVELADQLLEAGNYRTLNAGEIQKIFKELPDYANEERSIPGEARSMSLFTNIFLGNSYQALKELVEKAAEGPPPAWPRVMAALMRKGSDRFSLSLTTVLWIWIWLFAWWLTGPSLRLPFENRELAFRAMLMYGTGSILVPLLIGLLINTKDNGYWKEKKQVKPSLLRLYTYQGAAIGFNLGYFFVLPIVLLSYYLGYGASVWLEFAATGLGLILGNMAARVVPHNLWRAYGRLTFKDGRIFFVVAMLGPIWGFFFFHYYPLFLTPLWGTLVILMALTITVVIVAQQAKKQV